MKKETEILIRKSKARERLRSIEAGFYDGRYKPKVIKDKRREADKKVCRTQVL